uniref:4HBT domain-containing protein n=1 Tax=Toxocara canis TaxID=6265 RepID=A0A183U4B9_TOXCA
LSLSVCYSCFDSFCQLKVSVIAIPLHFRYLAAAHPGDTIVIDGSVLRSGRTLAYTRADIFRKKDNLLIATAQHTKAFPASKNK